MSLSDVAIRNAKAKDKNYTLTDRDGLSLLIRTSGTKSWIFRFYIDGKQQNMSFGVYPAITLQIARDLCLQARRQLAQGIDPRLERKQRQHKAKALRQNTFAALAERWYEFRKPRFNASERNSKARQIRLYLDKDILPKLGDIPIKEITRADVIALIRRVESRGTLHISSYIRGWLKQIFRFGIAEGIVEHNLAADLDIVAIPKPPAKHNPYLKTAELAEFFQALNNHPVQEYTRLAIKVLFLTAVRTGELRYATINQFNFKQQLWIIPAANVKQLKKETKAADYVVPLSRQAVESIKRLHKITGEYTLILPGRNDPSKPISDNTINVALKRMGYQHRLTGHGIRATISTALNEQGYNPDWIEAQLSHKGLNQIRATYNHAMYVEQRKEMMQNWADYLETLGL